MVGLVLIGHRSVNGAAGAGAHLGGLPLMGGGVVVAAQGGGEIGEVARYRPEGEDPASRAGQFADGGK